MVAVLAAAGLVVGLSRKLLHTPMSVNLFAAEHDGPRVTYGLGLFPPK